MAANSAADALTRFLTTTPDLSSATQAAPAVGDLMEILGQLLASRGDGGLPIPDAMQLSGLSRPDFLGLLSRATAGGLFEIVDQDGVQSVRLTPAGRSLY